MKTPILASLALLALAAGSMADPDPDRAPFIDGQIKELQKKVASDLTAGTLTKPDGDELNREIDHVKSIAGNEPSLTPATRRDLREKLATIQKDLERKEAQAKSLASPSATP